MNQTENYLTKSAPSQSAPHPEAPIKTNFSIIMLIISGIGLLIFIPSAYIVKHCFVMELHSFTGRLIQQWALLYKQRFSHYLYQAGLFTAPIGLLGMLPLILAQHYPDRRMKVLRNICAAGFTLVTLPLLVQAIKFEELFNKLKYFNLLETMNLTMTVLILLSAACTGVLCLLDGLQYNRTDVLKMVLLIIAAALFLVSCLPIGLMTLLSVTSHDYYQLPRLITLMIAPFIALFAARLKRIRQP